MLLDGLSVWCIVLLYVFFKTYSSIPDTHSYSSMLYTPDTHPNSTNSFCCGGNGMGGMGKCVVNSMLYSYICVLLILLVLHTATTLLVRRGGVEGGEVVETVWVARVSV